MNLKSTEKIRATRKKTHARRKGYTDTHIEKEDLTYGAGKF